MTVRHHARSLVALAALLAASASAVAAQAAVTRTPPRPDTPRLMVQVFGSVDKKAGPEASDELRERLIRAFPSRILWVIDRKDIIAVLEQSGYDTLQQLPPSDESTLAKSQRADEYIRGQVTREGAEYKVQAWIVLTRDNSLTQPLPVATGARPDRAVAAMVKSIQDARRQLDDEKKCMAAARDSKFAEAIAFADAGIVEYPQATLVRYCKMNVLVRQEASDSAKLKAADEILAIDPNSKAALAIAADAQKKLGNLKEANDLLLRLLAANPTDAQLVNNVIEALAASGDFARAKEVVLKAVAENPGDMDLISLQFRILIAAKEWKAAARTGEEMVQMDTSLADVVYFQRMVAVFDADSQPQKAAEAAAKATQKFPQDADLWQLYSGALKKAGQVQQSIAAAKRALEINPKIANGWTQVAIAYNELNMPDSALAALRAAKAAGDNAEQVGGFAMNIGNRLFRAANADTVKTVAAFRHALEFLHFADSTATEAQTKLTSKFLIGASSVTIGNLYAQNLATSKSCDEAKLAQAALTDALIYTQQGGRAFPEQAGNIMNGINQLTPYIDQQIKTLCK